jgi:hypothetical protein
MRHTGTCAQVQVFVSCAQGTYPPGPLPLKEGGENQWLVSQDNCKGANDGAERRAEQRLFYCARYLFYLSR